MGVHDDGSELATLVAEKAAAQIEVLKLESGDVLAVRVGIADMGGGLPPWIPGPREIEAIYHDVSLVVPEGVKVLISHMGVNYEIIRGLDTSNAIVVKAIPDS